MTWILGTIATLIILWALDIIVLIADLPAGIIAALTCSFVTYLGARVVDMELSR